MKKLIIILAIFTSILSNAQLVEIQPDSIVDNTSIAESGRYIIYMDNVPLKPTHTKYGIASLRLNSLYKKYPNVDLRLEYPTARPTGTVKYFIDKSKLTFGLQPLTIEAAGNYTIASSVLKDNDEINLKGDLEEVVITLPSIDDTSSISIINMAKTILIVDDITYSNISHLTFLREDGKWKLFKN